VTTLTDRRSMAPPGTAPQRSAPTATTSVAGDPDGPELATSSLGPRRLAFVSVLGVAVLVVVVGAVLYAVGPLVHDREQRRLLATERAAIARAARDDQGLFKAVIPTQPPLVGSLVGILAVSALGLQQAIVEGVGPSQTVTGPGHVPGTAGLGQPGNSVVVGRRLAFGGPFASLDELRPGDQIVTATTQGESLYVVRSVRTVTVVTPPTTASVATATTTTVRRPAVAGPVKKVATSKTAKASSATTSATHAPRPAATITTTGLYGPSSHDQLTLVTSATSAPWNSDEAVVVVARMHGAPFAPTPQESRSPDQLGTSGDPDALAWLLLALLGFLAVLVGAVALYRRTTMRTAYLLTTAPLLALTVLTAEAASHVLPAWL
jgi:sortase A